MENNNYHTENLEDNFCPYPIAHKGKLIAGYEMFLGNTPSVFETFLPLIQSHAVLLDIVKTVKFWFDNENNYPEGTAGYRIAQQAKEAIENANKIINLKN